MADVSYFRRYFYIRVQRHRGASTSNSVG